MTPVVFNLFNGAGRTQNRRTGQMLVAEIDGETHQWPKSRPPTWSHIAMPDIVSAVYQAMKSDPWWK
jgi:hypothetical protein